MAHRTPARPDPASAGAPSRLPTEAWLLGWSFLAGQVLTLLDVGSRQADEVSLVLSMVLGALLVGWISAGVLTARPVRFAGVCVLVALAIVADVVGLFSAGGSSGWALAHLAASLASAAALAAYARTDYVAWRRTRPTAAGPSIAPVLAIAVVVGALGGIIGAG